MARLPVLLVTFVGLFVPAPALRGPVDVSARRAVIGRALPTAPSAPLAPPIRDLSGVSYYLDASRSIADPTRKKQNEAAFAPLRAYVARVIDLADGWMESKPADPTYAIRAVDALATWARLGALLGNVNQQGSYERVWTLAGLALAYLKVRDAPRVDPAALAAVDAWLVKVAVAVEPRDARPGRMSDANNHADWAALAVAAAGAAAHDRALFGWGLARARIGIAQIRPDGFMPLELGRGAMALHYHLFALAPLVMMAELCEANGVDLYAEEDGAIGRLANRVIDGLRDPAPFAAAAGVPQQVRPPRGPDLAWAEPYHARFHDRRLTPLLAAARPLRDDRLGGDLTAAFGLPDQK